MNLDNHKNLVLNKNENPIPIPVFAEKCNWVGMTKKENDTVLMLNIFELPRNQYNCSTADSAVMYLPRIYWT